METSKIVLLDLRESPGDQLAEIAGGVVVLDDAGSLLKHADVYMSLASDDMVTGIVCVAVGESTTDAPSDGAVLAVPQVLQYATVLWVGDPRGVAWAPKQSAPRPADGERDALDGLIAALRVPAVFDRVVALSGDLSGFATCPGVQLVSVAVGAAELAETRAAVVRSLCRADQPPSPALGTAVRQVDAVHDPEGAVLAGPVAAARNEALRRLDRVGELARLLGTWRAVFGASRPTARLGDEIARAGEAAEKSRLYLVELLNRMDGHLEVGRPSVESVVELGVQRPREARGAEIAAELKHLVEARLDEATPPAVLAQELRLAATAGGPQGCAAALDQVRKQGPLALAMPSFRIWPLSLLTLPAVFLSCAVLALLLGPGASGWLGAGLLAAGWFGAGWLLMSRRPGQTTELGLGDAFLPSLVYAGAGVLGVAAGVGARESRPELSFLLSPLTAQILSLVVVLAAAAGVALSWRSAARRWAAELPVTQLRHTLVELTRLAEEATTREWQPVRRRRAVAMAASEIAAGLEEIVGKLEEADERLFVAPPPGALDLPSQLARPAPPELYDVVRGDLLDLCRTALAPAWAAAEGTRVPSAGVFAQRMDRLLDQYDAHVSGHGLMTAPEFGLDPAPRTALTARIWSESPESLAALRSGVDGEMTQLCRSVQLRYLSTAARPGLIRFAPAQLQRALDEDGTYQRLAADRGITWTGGGELVGAVRLLPLRPESVRRVLGGVS
ncbi:hypothetical protein ILP97_02700 [Amycolatopsis sp. H6(2020)]|nr:hypothetical protein [Amycolatopsis sp. H6(2020)]